MRSLLLAAALALILPIGILTWLSSPRAMVTHRTSTDAVTGEFLQVAKPEPTPVTAGPGTMPVIDEPAPTPVVAPPQPVPPPRATPVWSKAPALQHAADSAMTDFTGRYSAVVWDLTTGQNWQHRADDRYHPASTIKMPVTLYALDQHIAGNLGWGDLITYLPQDFESPGGGAFETSPFYGQYPVENLFNRALMYSNNVAVNMLGRHLGWDNIRAFTRRIDGELYRLPDGMPQVTAMSEVGWWRHLHSITQEHPVQAELFLNPLGQVAYDGRIAAGLPADVKYYHKFGSYDGNFHDGAMIYAEKPYVLVILTHGATGGEGEADPAIARLTAAIHAVMTAPDKSPTL